MLVDKDDIDWNITIDNIHKSYLLKLSKRRKGILSNMEPDKEFIDIGSNTFIPNTIEGINQYLSKNHNIDNTLSYITTPAQKVAELFNLIERLRYVIFQIENKKGCIYLRKISRDYANGFTYPLNYYSKDIFNYLNPKTTPTKIRSSKYKKVEPTAEILQPVNTWGKVLHDIGALIEAIETASYCHKLLDEIVRSNVGKPKKLNWNGTPGEFGAIFNKLFDAGYIEIVKDKKNMVKVLNEIFEIKNEKSVSVTDNNLYRCFLDKEKNYNPGQLKIPLSDNYDTGK